MPELVEYFDGLLPPERQSEIEEHLADCPACTARAVRSLPNKEADGGPMGFSQAEQEGNQLCS